MLLNRLSAACAPPAIVSRPVVMVAVIDAGVPLCGASTAVGPVIRQAELSTNPRVTVPADEALCTAWREGSDRTVRAGARTANVLFAPGAGVRTGVRSSVGEPGG